jgi:hypothetical protein
MALDPIWTADRQFQKDRGKPERFGMPAAIVLATAPNGDTIELEVDLDLHEPPDPMAAFQAPSVADALAGKDIRQKTLQGKGLIIGVQYLCPRCMMPCYVPSTHHPASKSTHREIVVHWDKPLQSTVDGKYRPTLTIVGDVLVCDYLNSEIIGISSSSGMRCGWKGFIEDGRAIDHSTFKARPKK